jgi:RNA polymerase-binding transcription factor DksA
MPRKCRLSSLKGILWSRATIPATGRSVKAIWQGLVGAAGEAGVEQGVSGKRGVLRRSAPGVLALPARSSGDIALARMGELACRRGRAALLDAFSGVEYGEIPGWSDRTGPRPRKTMTNADVQRFRAALLALRARIKGDFSHLTDEAMRARAEVEGVSMAAAPDMADQGSDSYEHDLSLSLLQNQEHTLEEIAEALERINRGTFGSCEECGGAIARPRLQALPYTRHCVSCARKLQ